MSAKLGYSGALAKKFLHSEITPLLALVGLLLGVFAVMVTPREEEPQIDVTFANIFVAYPGASAVEVEQLISTPAEQVLSEITGVKHVYSVSQPGLSTLTVQYEVGEDRTQSIVKLYNAIYSHQDWLPANLGAAQPIIKPMGIDDVPIMTLTLWSDDANYGAFELAKVAHTLEAEFKRVAGTRDIYTLGAPDHVVHVRLDAQRMSGYGLVLEDLRAALRQSNSSAELGDMVADNQEVVVRAGTLLSSPNEVANLIVGVRGDTPVYLRDVADIRYGPAPPQAYVWLGTGPASPAKNIEHKGEFPAVTMAIAKKTGANAATVAETVLERYEELKGVIIPDGVQMTVTRNYGQTATDKAMTLIKKLIFATASVVLLVLVALGWREAMIVGLAVIITLAITLFASWAWGFTLNRVSLFALIFSIGILVDDAIVVVENIHRHMQQGAKHLLEAIPLAVDEVGGPTILATLTVIAALLPMAFVTGLMGPYMSPIPINASMGMMISLAVAFVITPWLMNRVMGAIPPAAHPKDVVGAQLHRWMPRLLQPFLAGQEGGQRRLWLFGAVVFLIVVSLSLFMFKLVILKMLPFDNKSEIQVVIDMPEGTSLERTAQVATELGNYLSTVPEVTDYQAYVGTASAINFNGLVRQYYLRSAPHMADIQVNLLDRHQRQRRSHEIAADMRAPLQEIGQRFAANVKIVEVPPGPPVQAPIVAEIYGMDYQGQIAAAKQVRSVFVETANVVDIDDSINAPAPRLILHVDRKKAALLGLNQAQVTTAIAAALGGEDVSYLHTGTAKYAIPIRMELPPGAKAGPEFLKNLKVRSAQGHLVPLSEVVDIEYTTREQSIYHKDLLPVVFVTADAAGEIDSPLYAMFNIYGALKDKVVMADETLQQFFISPPDNPYRYSIKWDGESQITYETFRDMGIAYSVGLILIYLLVVIQFRSYVVPLIIMAPIPLTIIGVLPGHALLGAEFTATSMIGMIALAGIIVRNSILLVDFINEQLQAGVALDQAIIQAGAVRAKPILLTGLAAMIGAFFILDDPIFNGLAISLIFGVLVSTLLTLMVIPLLYYVYKLRSRVS